MKIAISAESTIDLPRELLDKYKINVVPFGIFLGEQFANDGEITPTEIFAYVKQSKVLPKTSAVNEFQYKDHFKKLLETHDAIIHISLSSKISAACSQAQKAAEQFKNVFIIDSESLSTGIALLAIYASKLAEQGVDAKQIFQLTNARVPYVQASFVIERLDYLYKGGRCSGLQLLGANLFKLKPQIYLKDGAMHVGKKYKGKTELAIKQYCADILKANNTPDLEVAFVTYTTATDEMINEAETALKNAGFKTILKTKAGGTISCHCGEHTLGILYINDNKLV